ncbi:endonuclease/exonuclease/phosphatase family protein [Kitasatospora sp. NPDC058444]|uniref:endonuclease/exonuclease/phosphatase family protein n=1 Tax=Kitasatospora sp. NPDC058444 TaxID=3346504 RepID=UPI00366771BC
MIGSAPVRLATFNVLHGQRLPDDGRPPTAASGTAPIHPLVDAVVSLDADVVALQELDRFQERSGRVDQARAVAEATGAAHWRYASAVHARSLPGRTWVRDRSEPGLRVYGPQGVGHHGEVPSHGIALLSRLPVLSWRARRFGEPPVAVPLRAAGRAGGPHGDPRPSSRRTGRRAGRAARPVHRGGAAPVVRPGVERPSTPRRARLDRRPAPAARPAGRLQHVRRGSRGRARRGRAPLLVEDPEVPARAGGPVRLAPDRPGPDLSVAPPAGAARPRPRGRARTAPGGFGAGAQDADLGPPARGGRAAAVGRARPPLGWDGRTGPTGQRPVTSASPANGAAPGRVR